MVLCLVSDLTATTGNHMTIVEDGGLPAFFSLCNSPDLMSQYYVGCALANLSCSLANHHIIVEHGGLQALVVLAGSADPDVHQQVRACFSIDRLDLFFWLFCCCL